MHKHNTIIAFIVFIIIHLIPVKADYIRLQMGSHVNEIITDSQGLTSMISINETNVLTGYYGLAFKDFQRCFGTGSWAATCTWSSGTWLRIQLIKLDWNGKLTCTRYVWTTTDYSHVVKDCYDLEDAQWYGGGETYNQSWPIQIDNRRESPYVLNDVTQVPDYGGVLERIWFTSKGVVIRVDDGMPLFVSLNQTNDKKLCFVSKNNHPYLNRARSPPKLWYTVCTGTDLLTSYKDAAKTYLGRPTAAPDSEMFTYPFWNTWAKYHANINESIVLDFAKTINTYGFSKSLFQIDDKWEDCYGQLEFSKEAFPEPKKMISELKSMGFRVNVWVHPFINEECPIFDEAKQNGYFIKSLDKTVAITKWWNGKRAGIIDVTNWYATNWWKKRLQRLQNETGVNAFKFDAGETNWLPPNITFYIGHDDLTPNTYPKYYGQFANQFGKTVEVRQRYRNQNLPIFTRLLDRVSRWDNSLGLQTIIPTVLIFGILGYPYILPGMIGGNAYSKFPSKELYIRWMEVTALLPVMQFSVSPWQYDDEVVAIAKKMVQIHEEHSQLFIELAEEATKNGWPIIRPLWWLVPTDPDAQVIGSQFLVGEKVLVAPVLEEGATSRDIYLPEGKWYYKLTDKTFSGPFWLYNFPVKLEELAYFTAL